MLALGRGIFRLSGTARMHQRPIGDLINALTAQGIGIQCEHGNNCPPVIIQAHGLPGGRMNVRGDSSSQYLSGLMMAAPCAAESTELCVTGQLVSVPYVTMTMKMMVAFGASVEGSISPAATRLTISRGPYRARSYSIEPDATAASYFLAAAAITGGRVIVEGLSADSMQGDIRFASLLKDMGCRIEFAPDETIVEGGSLRGIQVEMTDISDTVQTLAAVALFAKGPTVIRGVGHIRHKETDRISDLARELRKLGATVDETVDGLTIVPGPLHGATISTYNDHRMAMSLSLVGLKVPGVVIENPACTQKTYAEYFHDLRSLTGPQ
jgi:3-phosphoshikimate 1-carboxyvinyltransferase